LTGDITQGDTRKTEKPRPKPYIVARK
jgi:hypothetical protein